MGSSLRILGLFISCIWLSSCSTTVKDFFANGEDSDQRNEKLVIEDFKEEKKVFEKFVEVKPIEEPVIQKTEKSKKSIESKKRVAIRPPKLKKKLKNKKKIVPQEEKSIYPKDFPEEYIVHDKSSINFWDKFEPILYPGEKMILNITYLGVDTGKITISTKESKILGESLAYHVNARIKTADFYSYLYKVDDYCDSYVKQDGFIPLKFSLIQRQSSQDIDDLQLFDHKELTYYSFYKRVTKDKNKKKKEKGAIPQYFQDPLSVMYFIRGLPMDPNVEYVIPLVNQGKVEVLKAKFEKLETLSTKLGSKEAYKVNVNTKHEGQTIKGGNMTFWFSADDLRLFLKFQAKIKIGNISGELESYEK